MSHKTFKSLLSYTQRDFNMEHKVSENQLKSMNSNSTLQRSASASNVV